MFKQRCIHNELLRTEPGRRRKEGGRKKMRVVIAVHGSDWERENEIQRERTREQSVMGGIYEDEFLLLPLAFALCQVIVLS